MGQFNNFPKNQLVTSARSSAFKMILWQLCCLCAIAFFLSFFQSQINHAMSFFLGGMAYILPNFYFAYRFMGSIQKREPKSVVMAFYREEIIKMALCIAILFSLLKFVTVSPLWLFSGFFVSYLALWIKSFNTHKVALS